VRKPEGKIVKTQKSLARLVRPLRRCGLSANMVGHGQNDPHPAPKMLEGCICIVKQFDRRTPSIGKSEIT